MPLTKPIPPTPPTIDKGEASESTPRIDVHQFFDIPFKRETKDTEKVDSVEKATENTEKPAEKTEETSPATVEKKVTTPEDMARDAVANGGGALTKKTITRPDAETNTPTQNNSPATSNITLTTEKSNRGKEILREFQNEDRQTFQSAEPPRTVKINSNESYSGFYWIGMIIFVAILSVVFVRKVLVKKNPPLKKSDLFDDADKRLKAVSEKVNAPKINPAEKISVTNAKAVEKITASKINSTEKIKKSPPKNDDDKGKHFEVRI